MSRVYVWGWVSFSELLPIQTQGSEFKPQNPCILKSPRWGGKDSTSLSPSGQPAQPIWHVTSKSERCQHEWHPEECHLKLASGLHMCVYTCVHIWTHTHTYTQKSMSVYTHSDMHTCILIHVSIYTVCACTPVNNFLNRNKCFPFHRWRSWGETTSLLTLYSSDGDQTQGLPTC